MLAVALLPHRIDPRGMVTNADRTEAALLGRALANLRQQQGLSQPDAAENFGVTSAANWSKYELGKAPTIFRPEVQRRLAAAIGVSVEDLMIEVARLQGGGAPSRQPSGTAVNLAEVPRRGFDPSPTPGMAAVYGLAAAEGEAIAIAAGSEIRYVPMHPAQRGYSRIGAVEIVGESMYPRWKPRELAYFVFDMPPPRGDDVIVELEDGTAIIKEYVGRTATHLMLKEWHPQERVFDLPLVRVKALHAVVG